MTKEIEEYKQKVEKLGQEIVHYKITMTNLSQFNACTLKLREELSTLFKS